MSGPRPSVTMRARRGRRETAMRTNATGAHNNIMTHAHTHTRTRGRPGPRAKRRGKQWGDAAVMTMCARRGAAIPVFGSVPSAAQDKPGNQFGRWPTPQALWTRNERSAAFPWKTSSDPSARGQLKETRATKGEWSKNKSCGGRGRRRNWFWPAHRAGVFFFFSVCFPDPRPDQEVAVWTRQDGGGHVPGGRPPIFYGRTTIYNM